MPETITINLQPCQSSQIEAWGYDAESQTLGLRFVRGATYHYTGVPQDVADAFFKAESVGKFFGANIKNKFNFERQADAPKQTADDCYHRAAAGEPKFTLIGRDPMAGALARLWAEARESLDEDPAKITDARDVAASMDVWARGLGKRPVDVIDLLPFDMLADALRRRGALVTPAGHAGNAEKASTVEPVVA